MRTCTKCGVEKQDSEFSKNGYDAYGNARVRSACKECDKNRIPAEKQRKYVAQYRKNNPAKVAQNQRNTYLRKQGVDVPYEPRQVGPRPGSMTEEDYRQYRRDNAEEIRAYHKWYQENCKEKRKETLRKYAQKNKAKLTAKVVMRNANKLQATPKWANKEKIEEFYFASDFLGMVTGQWYHVDHIVPLQGPKIKEGEWKDTRIVQGLHCEANLRVIPGKENWSKNNRHWPGMDWYTVFTLCGI